MLPYYAARFPTVEINYTFYRMPSEKLLAGWAAQVPKAFRFTLKAPRRITHDAKLANCESLTATFCLVAGTLNDQLGSLLFQLPPSLKKDLPRLDAFLDTLPPKAPVAFEFRHPSWFDDEVFDRLRSRGRALCVADSEKLETPSGSDGRLRLLPSSRRRLSAERHRRRGRGKSTRSVRAATDIYVYFKHEEKGIGAEFARQLMRTWDADAP